MGRPLLRPLPRRPQGHGRRRHRPQPARRSPQQPGRRRDRHERRVQVPPDASGPRLQVPQPQDRPRALHHGRRRRDGSLFRGECRRHHRTPLPSPIMPPPTNTTRPPTTCPSSLTTGPPTWYVPLPPTPLSPPPNLLPQNNYCKPSAKSPSDRRALLDALVHSNGKFFLGTDSARKPASLPPPVSST